MTGQRGHPANEERQLAFITGERTYTGKRCRTCNGTLRYTKSGSCATCTKDAAGRVRVKSKANARRRKRAAEERDLDDLLGINNSSARGLHGGISETQTDQVSDESPKSLLCTPCTPRIAYGDESNIPSINADYSGGNSLATNRDLTDLGVHSNDSDAGSMASSDPKGVEDPRAQILPKTKIETRYFCHPESGCAWAGDFDGSDGLVEEISAEAFGDLIKAGFTDTTKVVNSSDDLDDILG